MKFSSLLPTILIVLSLDAAGSGLPNLACKINTVIQTNPKTLISEKYQSNDIYIIKMNKLYIASQDRGEYLYNSIIMTEPKRFTSGHKTILFNQYDDNYKDATFVHVYFDEVRTSKATCNKLM